MQNNDDELIKREIEENCNAIDRLKKLIPIGILTVIAFSFLYPLIPGRKSKESLADWLGYQYALIACLLLSGLVYWYGYSTAVNRRIRKINDLKIKLLSMNNKVIKNEKKK